MEMARHKTGGHTKTIKIKKLRYSAPSCIPMCALLNNEGLPLAMFIVLATRIRN
jgi:hypothetical protein